MHVIWLWLIYKLDEISPFPGKQLSTFVQWMYEYVSWKIKQKKPQKQNQNPLKFRLSLKGMK